MTLPNSFSFARNSELCKERYDAVPRAHINSESKTSPVVVIMELRQNADRTYSKEPTLTYSKEDELAVHLERQDFAIRVLFLCQTNSWSPLRATRQMIDIIMKKHRIMPEFLDLLAGFCDRDDSSEEGYSYPMQTKSSGSFHEACYAFKYVEDKLHGVEEKADWRIRQSGLYHQSDFSNDRNVFIVIAPIHNSAFRNSLENLLQSSDARKEFATHPILLHYTFMSTHISDFRRYLTYYEEELLPIWNRARVSWVQEDLLVTHENLSRVRFLESRILPIESALISLEKVLKGLDMFRGWLPGKRKPRVANHDLNHVSASLINQVNAHQQNTLFLKQRMRNTGEAIVDILQLKNQFTAQKESFNVKTITVVTMFYLPFSFVASLFGTNFFGFNPTSRHIEVSGEFWIYFGIGILFTALTICFWQWRVKMQKRKNRTVSPC